MLWRARVSSREAGCFSLALLSALLEHLQCLVDVRIVWCQFACFQQLAASVFQVSRAAIDESKVFMQKCPGTAVAAELQAFFQL
jgi:hypothetical protein